MEKRTRPSVRSHTVESPSDNPSHDRPLCRSLRTSKQPFPDGVWPSVPRFASTAAGASLKGISSLARTTVPSAHAWGVPGSHGAPSQATNEYVPLTLSSERPSGMEAPPRHPAQIAKQARMRRMRASIHARRALSTSADDPGEQAPAPHLGTQKQTGARFCNEPRDDQPDGLH